MTQLEQPSTSDLELAVPLFANPDPGAINIGTGLLAQRRGEIGLITAAHVPLNRQPIATPGWDGWPWRMYAVPPGAVPSVEITLFSNTIPVSPTFTWLVADAATRRMSDMIGLFSFVNRAAVVELSKHFRVFDLESPPVLAAGDVCTAVGFPMVPGRTDWPSYPARTCQGPFVSRTTEILRIDASTVQGYSGGPVVDAGGDLVGMVIGEDDGLSTVVSVEALSVL